MEAPEFAPPPDRVPLRRALISVSDKSGLAPFAEALARRGVEIVSSGGTARTLRKGGLAPTDVSDVTGFPEILDGRVKTLHPFVHAGILAVRNAPAHLAALEAHKIAPFDLVVSNLYPFEKMVEAGATTATAIEAIDIGGPALIRAAAKNHGFVAVAVDPGDYDGLLAELDTEDGATTLATRRRLAAKAFARTAAYDTAIAQWLAEETGEHDTHWRSFSGRLSSTMRYGENPHQTAAFYRAGRRAAGIAAASLVQGKPLSYNNLADADAALELVAEFEPARSAAVAIVKHANPCGVAEAESQVVAYEKALRCDPQSAFGGIVALNQPLDALTAKKIIEIFTEVIVAPSASKEAIDILAGKPNLRLLLTHGLPDPRAAHDCVRSVSGGLLVQSRDNAVIDDLDLEVATARAPTEHEWADLRFAWRVVKHVKSNAIVYAKDMATVGIGAGQMSRVDAARIAASKAREAALSAGETAPRTEGSVVASDAFFPFADGLLATIEAGATAVIQPGGSIRDAEVIAAADAAGAAMVFTGVRHFRH